MENCTPQETFIKAKKVVEILNQAKQLSFGNKTDLMNWLKEHKCPYFNVIVPYLSRNNELVPHGNFGFICFKDKKPYYFGDFVSVIERFRLQKNKFNKNYNKRKKEKNNQSKETIQITSTSQTQKLNYEMEAVEEQNLDKILTINVKHCSKWNKFWINLFFGIKV